MRCPRCASTDVHENTLYAWSASCRACGWSTSDYKPGPISKETLDMFEGRMSLYDYMMRFDGEGFDTYDNEFNGTGVCMEPSGEKPGDDPWADVNDWILRNIKFVSRDDGCSISADICTFIRANLEAFREFTERHNTPDYVVKGDDMDSLYAGVLTVDGLIVGNYADEGYCDFIDIFKLHKDD